MEFVKEKIVEVCSYLKRQLFALMLPAILPTHHQMNKIRIRQQNLVLAKATTYRFHTYCLIVLTHQACNLITEHKGGMGQRNIQPLLVAWQCMILILYQLISGIHGNHTLPLPKRGQIAT